METALFSIEFEDRDGFLSVDVSGPEDSLEVSLAYWKQLTEECERRGVRRVLVREEFPNQLSIVDMYALMEEVSEMVPVGLIVAFVDREAEHEELNMFAETVATNRRAAGRVFRDLPAAVEWLRQS